METIMLITLYCLSNINGERSIYSVYHLFKGKRSSQTIQDANLYNIKQFFGILPKLDRIQFENIVKQLLTETFIEYKRDTLIVTATGSLFLERHSLPTYINGWRYMLITPLFWGRLSVAVQSLSNIIHYNNKFIPINRDDSILSWVRGFLKNQPFPRDVLSLKIYEELRNLLTKLDERSATIFVLKLTGKKRIGLTNEQIAKIQSITLLEVQINFISTIHFFLSQVENKKGHFPLLSEMAKFNKHQLVLTESTKKTYELLKLGRTIEQVATIRKLKKNTIEDHVIEIALTDNNFNHSIYMDEQRFEEISRCILSLKTNQLKVIKQAMSKEVSYFEIRLVLAKVGGKDAT
jgi:uncharacterized protein YpbB